MEDVGGGGIIKMMHYILASPFWIWTGADIILHSWFNGSVLSMMPPMPEVRSDVPLRGCRTAR